MLHFVSMHYMEMIMMIKNNPNKFENSAEVIKYIEWFNDHFLDIELINNLNWDSFLESNLKRMRDGYLSAIQYASFYDDALRVDNIWHFLQKEINCMKEKIRCRDCIMFKINNWNVYEDFKNKKGLCCCHGCQGGFKGQSFSLEESFEVFLKVYEYREKLRNHIQYKDDIKEFK